jgi:hypothetical protein
MLSSVAACTYFSLPETVGQPLPDTIEQVEKLAAEQKCRRYDDEWLSDFN